MPSKPKSRAKKSIVRCSWCPLDDDFYVAYHDKEWGVPVRDGRHLFEMLNLEGAQAGLSWRTILGRRDAYRKEFDRFDPARLARWSEARKKKALLNPGIIRNRLKVEAVVRNSRAIMTYFGGDLSKFSAYLWKFVDNKPIANVPLSSRTAICEPMSKELRKLGFTFVGPTICYAFMQAVGMVNDHDRTCFLYRRTPSR